MKYEHKGCGKDPDSGNSAEYILPPVNRTGKEHHHAAIVTVTGKYAHGEHGCHKKHDSGYKVEYEQGSMPGYSNIVHWLAIYGIIAMVTTSDKQYK